MTSLGATLLAVRVPDRDGRLGDVALGHDGPDAYLDAGSPYFGATVGRVANRIRKGLFEMDGRRYALDKNDGDNHLHGGRHVGWVVRVAPLLNRGCSLFHFFRPKGFHRAAWRSAVDRACGSVTFSHVSEDGEGGYPGHVVVFARYRCVPCVRNPPQ